MVRRPLERPAEKFTLLASIMPASRGLPPYVEYAPDSLYSFENEKAVSAALGFRETPDGKMDFYPRKAPALQHKNFFLQWGWAADNRQIAFEIGDASTILSMHFRRNGHGKKLWRLDMIEIDDGKREQGDVIPTHIPCDEVGYAVHVKTVFQGVQAALPLLNGDACREAEKAFHARLDPLVRELDRMSEQMARDHAAEVMGGAAPAYRP